jgi:hypothetical protein
MEADAHLEDAVIEAAHWRARVAPQKLERFVLLEELTGIELLDPVEERFRRRIGTARAGRLVRREAGASAAAPTCASGYSARACSDPMILR